MTYDIFAELQTAAGITRRVELRVPEAAVEQVRQEMRAEAKPGDAILITVHAAR